MRGIYGYTCVQPVAYLSVLQEQFSPACVFSALSEMIFLSPLPDVPTS